MTKKVYQVLNELFFGNCFDCPCLQAEAGEVSGDPGRKVAHLDVVGTQQLSRKKNCTYC